MSTPFKRVDDIYKRRAPFSGEGYVLFIVNKELSKNMALIELVNELQRHTNLPPEMHFRIMNAFAPLTPRPRFHEFPWIWKGKTKVDEDVEIVAKHYRESIAHAEDYVEIFRQTEDGKEHLEWLRKVYGKKNKLKKAKAS